jgi:hypothetical protein
MTDSLQVGDRVRLATPPPYFKTADPMPMLRPPDLITVGEVGEITEQRLANQWVIKFERNQVLLDQQYLERVNASDTESDA